MVGRVPVRVTGDAPDNSFLVPSGNDDGLARAVDSDELRGNSRLKSQCFAVVWKQLSPDEDGTRRVLCYTVASPTMPTASPTSTASVSIPTTTSMFSSVRRISARIHG